MSVPTENRRSFLTDLLTRVAGGWALLGAGSALATWGGGCPSPGATVKYGGPPNGSGPKPEAPEPDAATPSADLASRADAAPPPEPPPRKRRALPPPTRRSPASFPPIQTKYGGPGLQPGLPVTKYGGPPLRPPIQTKYGGPYRR